MSRILSVAFCALTLSAPALAQTRVMTEHDQTALALNACSSTIGQVAKSVLSAARQGRRDTGLVERQQGLRAWSPGVVAVCRNRGREWISHESPRGRPPDVYDVKFKHRELTFYIARDSTDGKIHYMHTRSGSPDDENSQCTGRLDENQEQNMWQPSPSSPPVWALGAASERLPSTHRSAVQDSMMGVLLQISLIFRGSMLSSTFPARKA